MWTPRLPEMASARLSVSTQNSQTPAHLARGYFTAVLAAAFLSTTAILIRHLTQTYQLPSLILAFWRDVFVVATLLPAIGLLRPALLKAGRRNLAYLALYGLVLAFFNTLWTLSVALNGAAVATVLAYCSSAFTALLGWWFLKERIGWLKIAVITACIAGCVLVSGAYTAEAWNSNLGGILAGLFSGLAYALYSLMGRSASQRGLSPWTTLIYTFAFASVFLLGANLLQGGPLPGSAQTPADLLWLGSSLPGWGVLFILAAVPTVMGFGMYNVSLSLLPSSVANLIVTVEPVFTVVTAFFLLGETLSGAQIGGSLLILGGVAFLRVVEGWQERRAEKEDPAVY